MSYQSTRAPKSSIAQTTPQTRQATPKMPAPAVRTPRPAPPSAGIQLEKATRLGHDFSRLPVASHHADPPKAGGGGSPLPSPVRSKMERALGTDLSRVRIHQGEEAESVGALAYTRGTDLHFQRGAYDPTSAPGQRLLGHELAHVVQQAQGRVASPAGGGAPINDDPRLEAEAEAAGARAASGAAPVGEASVAAPPVGAGAPS